jgi:hypothetical protein
LWCGDGLRWAVHGEQETVADGGRRRWCSGRNWRATGGWGARVEVGEASEGVGGSNGQSIVDAHDEQESLE